MTFLKVTVMGCEQSIKVEPIQEADPQENNNKVGSRRAFWSKKLEKFHKNLKLDSLACSVKNEF